MGRVKNRTIQIIKKYLESRMLGNLHVRVGVRVQFPGLHHVYTRPEDPKRPLVCMDGCPKQLIGETRTPLPAEPGTPVRFDTEYVRNGTCELFMFVAPLAG
jgi:hypothetical protein